MTSQIFSLVLLAALTSATPIDPPAIELAIAPLADGDDPYRLPEGAVDVDLYTIRLSVDDDTFTTTPTPGKFKGETTILFKNLLDTSEIKLHSEVAISTATLTEEDGTPVVITNTEYVSDGQTAILTLSTDTPLSADTIYILHFEYIGDLRIALNGFYRSTYLDENGDQKILGATQFEPTHARKAFPSFDEPSYKARFDISIRHPTTYSAISNTHGTPEPDVDDPDFTVTTFLTSPIMPTYLVAFVVSDFTCTTGTVNIDGNIPQNVCSRSETAPIRNLTLEYTPQLTAALEDFTGVPYSTSTLTKLHQFAIPDFSAGAMENWGLITYREVYLLWDPERSSNRNKQNVITIVTHELSHFWFGNLLTTHWWSDIFLNEGFATYFEYHAAHAVVPSFELDKQFVIEQLQPVLVSDASPNSAALSSPASTPAQISGRFSSISYNKGGSIFRMVEHFIGLDNFKSGINKYLLDNQFGSAEPGMLWTAFDNFVSADLLPYNQPLATVMENWINNPGYPVVTVSIQSGLINFTQKRYLSSGEPGAEEQWYIPVSYTTSSDLNKFQDTKPKLWMTPGSTHLISGLRNESDWIILNIQQTGYYRVDYDAQLWSRINTALNKPGFDGIHELNRAQLVDDFFNFARYGHKSYADLLEHLTFLRKDTSYFSWYAAFNVFSYITQRISNDRLRQAVTHHILDLVNVLYSSLAFNEAKDDDQIYTLKKVLVIPWTCRLGLQDCVNHAVGAFATYRRTLIKPDKNLRATIYCNGLRYSTNVQSDYNFLWGEYTAEELATEQTTILSSIGCAKDLTVLNDYLSKSIDSTSGIRQQDGLNVFSSVYVNNPEGVDVALDFLVNNFPAIRDYYNSLNSLSSLFSGLTGRFTRREQTDKFLQFIENGNLGEAESTARQYHANAVANLDFIQNFNEELYIYFRVPAPPEPGTPEYRLPSDAFEVKTYDIELRLDNATFYQTLLYDGSTIIRFASLKATNLIQLHANNLNFSEVILKTQYGTIIPFAETTDFVSNPVTDILTLTTLVPLNGGSSYELAFTYKAQFRTNEMYGFYRSTYIAADGSERTLGATQFQATHARKVFPCFDEPSFKAEFTLTIRHPNQFNAIANTAGFDVRDPNDLDFLITYFPTTPKMSTYLLAFVVSDFTCGESTAIEGGGTHSVCSRDEAAPLRAPAEDVGPKLIKVMQDFTGIPYSASGLTKMHQVAIPDFSAGAMENWGILTYRETGLLWDPDQDSNSYLQSLKNVVSHEIAHMWFGNLITTHWWSDTFLNEGFARYFQYFATAEVEPEWELDKQFVTAQVQSILVSDAQPSAVALSSEANSPSQVSGRFASVSYNKGASVIRMLKHVMGENNFKTGLQKYLSDHKFGNTMPADLWSALQTSVGTTLPNGVHLAAVMENWITRPGFPILHVNSNGTTVTISQERFLVSGTPGANEKWYVPVTYTLSSDANKFEDTSVRQWLLPNANLVLQNALPGNDWIILNNQQIGYYRVHYSDQLLSRISTALNATNFSDIPEINRAQLVDDIYNLAKVGTIPYRQVFQFFQFLQKDTSYYPWYSALNGFSDMLQRTGSQRLRTSLSALFVNYMQALIPAVPFDRPDNNNQIYTFNRVQAITWACRLNQQSCVQNAVAAFNQYKETNVKPDKNLKGSIYCNGLRHSTAAQEDFDFLWGEYVSAKLATEKATILSALGCVRDPAVVNNFLLKSIDGTSIKQQDASSVFSSVYSQNPEGVDAAFDFLLENYQAISAYYGSMNSLNNLFSGLAARFTTEGQVDKLRNFLDIAPDLTESLDSAARAALANAQANLEWTEQFEKQLSEYFNFNTDPDTDDEPSPADVVKAGFSTMIFTIFMVCYQMLI